MNFKLPTLALALLALFTGCAAIQQQNVASKEKSLVAAGFQLHAVPADKQAAFASLTPYKLQSRVHKGYTVYLFPDPKNNICYIGNTQAYASYRKMVASQEQVSQAEMTQQEMSYWGPGALGPGFAPASFGGVPNRVF
ncbi:hypothetical protein BH09VER1_BH09VER1_40850 [soil metagenome]